MLGAISFVLFVLGNVLLFYPPPTQQQTCYHASPMLWWGVMTVTGVGWFLFGQIVVVVLVIGVGGPAILVSPARRVIGTSLTIRRLYGDCHSSPPRPSQNQRVPLNLLPYPPRNSQNFPLYAIFPRKLQRRQNWILLDSRTPLTLFEAIKQHARSVKRIMQNLRRSGESCIKRIH